MKTTIKLSRVSSITIKPNGAGVQLGLHGITETVAVVELNADQVGALLFAIEQAAEAAQIAQDRAAA
jgi:hypothetical protein